MTSLTRRDRAFPVRDPAEAPIVYGTPPGRRPANDPVDFGFPGRQIAAHLTASAREHQAHNAVDGQEVPARHFAVILSLPGTGTQVRR